MPVIAPTQDLDGALAEPDAFGPFGRPYLVLALDTLRETHADEIGAKLSRLPCPILAVATKPQALASACDVVVDDVRTLDGMIANIRAAPIAAMTLVQLLRASEGLDPQKALSLESFAYGTLQAGEEFRCWLRTRKTSDTKTREVDQPVLVTRTEDTLDIVLNRPHNRNAISIAMRDALCEAFDLAALGGFRRVTLRGAGKCFSVGGALGEFGRAPDAATAHAVRSTRLPAAQLLPVREKLEAHLHGACIGAGVEIPAFAARVTAAPATFFHLPEIRMGLIPGAGGCISLPRRIGRQKTAWLALSARRLSAETALAWGLIDAIEA